MFIKGQYCYYFDARNPSTTHHANYSIDGTEKWWQSPPLSRSLDYNQVNLTIDLGQVKKSLFLFKNFVEIYFVSFIRNFTWPIFI